MKTNPSSPYTTVYCFQTKNQEMWNTLGKQSLIDELTSALAKTGRISPQERKFFSGLVEGGESSNLKFSISIS